LRDRAVLLAEKKGFSSLQDMMRLFLAQFVNNKIDVGFTEPSERLSPRAARRYDKMVEDIESGKTKTKTFSSVKDLMADLNS
jgi:hypothetical protein